MILSINLSWWFQTYACVITLATPAFFIVSAALYCTVTLTVGFAASLEQKQIQDVSNAEAGQFLYLTGAILLFLESGSVA